MLEDEELESPREKVYCKYCGSKLVQDTTITGYNEFTGASIRPFLHLRLCIFPPCLDYRSLRLRARQEKT